MWQGALRYAYPFTGIFKILHKVFVADDEVNAKLAIDNVETVVCFPVTLYEFGKYLPRLSNLVEWNSKSVVEMLMRL